MLCYVKGMKHLELMCLNDSLEGFARKSFPSRFYYYYYYYYFYYLVWYCLSLCFIEDSFLCVLSKHVISLEFINLLSQNL